MSSKIKSCSLGSETTVQKIMHVGSSRDVTYKKKNSVRSMRKFCQSFIRNAEEIIPQ